MSSTYERVTVTEWKTTPTGAMTSLDLSPRAPMEMLKYSKFRRSRGLARWRALLLVWCEKNGRAEVQAIGAGATNQAVKAIAIAREYSLETDTSGPVCRHSSMSRSTTMRNEPPSVSSSKRGNSRCNLKAWLMIQPARSSVDLHCHSTASDGTLSPADVVSYAAKGGLETIA